MPVNSRTIPKLVRCRTDVATVGRVMPVSFAAFWMISNGFFADIGTAAGLSLLGGPVARSAGDREKRDRFIYQQDTIGHMARFSSKATAAKPRGGQAAKTDETDT